MARILPTNTAVRVVVGPIVTGSCTLPASITVTSLTMHAWSEANDGGAPTTQINSVLPTASGGANDMTYLSPGWFDLELTASQLNWLGRGRFQISQGTTYLPYFEQWLVVPAVTYNALVAGTDKLNVFASSVADPAGVTTGNAKMDSLTAYVSPGVSSIYGGMATAAALAIVDDFLDTEISSILGNVVAIKAKTDIIPSSPAALGDAMALTAATLSSINAEADVALVDIHLDHLLAADYDPASKPGVATALLNELVESDAGVSRYTANALEQAPTGAGVSVSSLAFAVWEEPRTSHTTAGTFGDVETTADIADAIWDEASTGHTDAGKAGAQLWTNVDAIKVKTDALPNSPAALGSAMTLDAATWLNLGLVASGTAQSATATTLVLAAASAFADDELNGAIVVITGGTGIGQSRVITNYTGSTDTAEVDAWTTTPSGTITYAIFAAAPASATSLPAVNVTQIAGSAVATGTAQLGVNVVSVTNDAITAAALAADVTTELQSGLATAATVNSLTAYVSPGISSIYNALDVEIASIKGDTAAVLLRANSLIAHVSPAISSIYGGMATAAALTVVDDFLDTEVSSLLGYGAAIQASVSSVTAHVSPGISSIYGGMATAAALTAVGDYVDTEVAALVASVDSLTTYVSPGVSSIYGGMATAAALAADVSSLTAYLTPAAIRADVGLASANLDTQLAAIPDLVLDEAVEGSFTLRQAQRLELAALAGTLSGAGTNSITIRDVNDTTNRIVAYVDSLGNRSVVTKDVG